MLFRSAIASYHAREHVIVMGPASIYGREDDRLTDFRKLDQTNIVIVEPVRKVAESMRAYFEHMELHEITVQGVSFYIASGQRFQYEKYRHNVLVTDRKSVV